MPDEVAHSSICHCGDCRGQSGAPMVAWAMVAANALAVEGKPAVYASSETGTRSFCGSCGTGLFFSNANLDGMKMVQVRVAALDNPDTVKPRMQVQTAERIAWVNTLNALPEFARFPG